MRFLSMIVLSWLLLVSGAVRAEGPNEEAWIEMMEVCFTVVADQSDAIMEEFPAATALLNLAPLPERAVRHPDSPVVASAVSDGSRWFMCLVAGKPAVKAAESGGLVGTITGTLASQINGSDDHALVLKDAFAPVRVTCQDNGGMTATLAFLNEDQEFRVAVANNLPSSVENPCFAAEEETGR